MFARLKQFAKHLKRELIALSLAYRDERTPWYAKAVVLVVLVYALSPIDLIPDVIPVLGYVDDLILVPLGILLALRLIPSDVMQDCRRRSEALTRADFTTNAGCVVLVWLVIALCIVWLLVR